MAATKTTPKARIYCVRLEPLADPDDPAGIRRLRWLLKVTFRRHGFRCRGVLVERPRE